MNSLLLVHVGPSPCRSNQDILRTALIEYLQKMKGRLSALVSRRIAKRRGKFEAMSIQQALTAKRKAQLRF